MDSRKGNSEIAGSASDKKAAALKYNDAGLKKYLKVDFDEAIADYSKALELDPNLAVAYFNRGTVLYRLGNYREALQDLVKAVSLDPRNPEFSLGLRDCQNSCRETEGS